jgi:hypothetical protein
MCFKSWPLILLRGKNKKFWEELIAYFPFIRHRLHRKQRFQEIFHAAGTSLPSRYLAMKEGINFTERLPSNDRKDTDAETPTGGRDL